jgi:cellulose synthase/poly-beta-1,6-N-acetylglucosamine synthase-like glycosyltransferase
VTAFGATGFGWLFEAVQWFFLAYFAGLNLVYIALNLSALRMVGRDSDARAIAALPDYTVGLEPAISIIVPAYNEALTIASSVRSMLQLDYPEFEILVVNDGSRDETLAVLEREFGLRPFPEAYRVAVPVKPVRGIYRSLQHPNLRVVDKVNGGRADAMNAGINAARHPLFCAVDADSILQRDSLRRIVRPFMEDRRVVACGGTVRVSNGCTISGGFLERVDMPGRWLPRVQIVEYLRAFLYGRLGWSPINALLIISGAFGLFRRQTVIDIGGFDPRTIGEDMDLVMRLHRHERDAGRDYRIVFVPDPVCWTEAPESLQVLRSQRVRWQRGLLECLWAHRGLMLSSRGGAAGWVAYPVYVLFEAIAPIVEVAGYLFMAVGFAMGWISPVAFSAFLLLAIGLGLMLSASALLLEEMTFRLYPRVSHLLTLAAAAVFENVGYRQLHALWRLEGIFKWVFRREQVWGQMQRKGGTT